MEDTRAPDKKEPLDLKAQTLETAVIRARENRAEAILADEEQTGFADFALDKPPHRYLVIESDEFGVRLDVYQADSLREIARLLESPVDGADITEIHDLDTGKILTPDFERIYRVPRIYDGRVIAYQSPPDDLWWQS